MKRGELLVEDVLLARVTDLEYALEVVFYFHLTLVFDGNGGIVVDSFGTGHQQEIHQFWEF